MQSNMMMNRSNNNSNMNMMRMPQPQPQCGAGQVAVQPIASLTPFVGNKAWIRVRVMDKSDIRRWSKPQSEGKLFSCTLVDESDAIRATFFQEGVDKFFDMIQNGGVYTVGGFNVKNANKRFTTCENQYELSFDGNSTVSVASDQDGNIPRERFNFVPISVLEHKEKYAPVDVMCCVTKISEPTSILSKKTGRQMMKRVLTVADPTASVDVTLWEEQAVEDVYERGMVLAVRNASVGHWDGVSLSFNKDTTIVRDPHNMEGTESLKKWYRNTGGESKMALSNKGDFKREQGMGLSRGRVYLNSIEAQNMGRGEKADFIDVRCTPIHVRTDQVWYDACGSCNKKVVPIPGQVPECYRCENCDIGGPMTSADCRYLASVHVSDGLDTQWLTLFNESGQAFFGCPARELKMRCQEAGNSDPVVNLSKTRIHRPMIATLRIKENTNSMSMEASDRIRCTGTRIEWVSGDGYSTESHQILKEIEKGYSQH